MFSRKEVATPSTYKQSVDMLDTVIIGLSAVTHTLETEIDEAQQELERLTQTIEDKRTQLDDAQELRRSLVAASAAA